MAQPLTRCGYPDWSINNVKSQMATSKHRSRHHSNNVIDWDQAKVVDRESNKMDRWIKEAIGLHRKEQDKSMNRDKGSYQLSHICDRLFTPSTSGGERKLSRPFRGRQQPLPKRP